MLSCTTPPASFSRARKTRRQIEHESPEYTVIPYGAYVDTTTLNLTLFAQAAEAHFVDGTEVVDQDFGAPNRRGNELENMWPCKDGRGLTRQGSDLGTSRNSHQRGPTPIAGPGERKEVRERDPCVCALLKKNLCRRGLLRRILAMPVSFIRLHIAGKRPIARLTPGNYFEFNPLVFDEETEGTTPLCLEATVY